MFYTTETIIFFFNLEVQIFEKNRDFYAIQRVLNLKSLENVSVWKIPFESKLRRLTCRLAHFFPFFLKLRFWRWGLVEKHSFKFHTCKLQSITMSFKFPSLWEKFHQKIEGGCEVKKFSSPKFKNAQQKWFFTEKRRTSSAGYPQLISLKS